MALVAVLDAGVREVAGVAELDARGGAVVREEGRDDAGEDAGGYVDRARVDGRPVERNDGRSEEIFGRDGRLNEGGFGLELELELDLEASGLGFKLTLSFFFFLMCR